MPPETIDGGEELLVGITRRKGGPDFEAFVFPNRNRNNITRNSLVSLPSPPLLSPPPPLYLHPCPFFSSIYSLSFFFLQNPFLPLLSGLYPLFCSELPNHRSSSPFSSYCPHCIQAPLLLPSIMATCGSLRTFFENPLPENPTLLESLSNWNKIHPRNPVGLSNLTEIFGELHFKEKLESPMRSPDPPSTWSSLIDPAPEPAKGEKPIPNLQKCSSLDSLLGTCKSEYMGCPMHKDCFLCRNSDSLPPPFTEGLGFESSDEVEDAKNEEKQTGKGKTATHRDLRSFSGGGSFKMSKTGGSFPPPPLTCMGKMGKPWVQFKSFKEDGRFVLREIKIPTLEVMRASRQDGRLKLHLVQQEEDESAEEEEEEAEEKEGDDEHGSSAMGVQTA